MLGTRPASEPPPQALARILDKPPPVAPGILRGGIRLTRRWAHGPLHDYLPTMDGHALVTYYGRPQTIVWTLGRERLASTTHGGSITLIPGTHEGYWDIAGAIGVSHVFLTDARVAQWSDEFAGGRRPELIGRVGHDDRIAARLMRMLGDEAESDEPSSRLFVEQAVDLLCTQILRRHSTLGACRPGAPVRGLARWQVRRIDEYLRAHLGEDIGLDALARVVGLSRFHVCTAFRLATGQTPHQRLMQLRMQRARELLANPTLRMMDIALAVGYENGSSFAAAFRRFHGATPSAMRRQLLS